MYGCVGCTLHNSRGQQPRRHEAQCWCWGKFPGTSTFPAAGSSLRPSPAVGRSRVLMALQGSGHCSLTQGKRSGGKLMQWALLIFYILPKEKGWKLILLTFLSLCLATCNLYGMTESFPAVSEKIRPAESTSKNLDIKDPVWQFPWTQAKHISYLGWDVGTINLKLRITDLLYFRFWNNLWNAGYFIRSVIFL